jgi:hypothetical protein
VGHWEPYQYGASKSISNIEKYMICPFSGEKFYDDSILICEVLIMFRLLTM